MLKFILTVRGAQYQLYIMENIRPQKLKLGMLKVSLLLLHSLIDKVTFGKNRKLDLSIRPWLCSTQVDSSFGNKS